MQIVFYLLHHTQLFCCLTFSKKSYWESVKRCLPEREREKINQTHLGFSFWQQFEMILHGKPVMWKSLDMGWNRWAVLHRRRSGGEVDLLERSLVIKVGPWIRSGDSPLPMEIFGGKSRPNLIWLSGIFSILLYIHLLTFYLFFWSIFLKLIFCRLVLDQSRVDKFDLWRKNWDLKLIPNPSAMHFFVNPFW